MRGLSLSCCCVSSSLLSKRSPSSSRCGANGHDRHTVLLLALITHATVARRLCMWCPPVPCLQILTEIGQKYFRMAKPPSLFSMLEGMMGMFG